MSTISGKLDLGGAARTITINDGTPGQSPGDIDLKIPAVISDSTAGLNIAGTGVVDLSAANTYTGTTAVTGGATLLVDGTIGPVQVGAGSTLGGSGTVGNVASAGGTITPGDGNGPLTTGSLTLDSNSTFAPQLVGPASTAFGQVAAGGAVSLGGTLVAALGNSYIPTPGDQLTIIRNNSGSGVTGGFTGLLEGSTVTIGGFPFKITYQGGTGHDVVLIALPLPTSTTVSASAQSSTYGQSLTFTATVSGQSGPALGGSVSFYDGTPSPGTLLGSATLNGADQATFATKALNAVSSPHQVYAVYGGSTHYASSTTTQPASVTITPATLTPTLVGTVTKTYDGTTTATLSGANYQLSGVVGTDVVSLNNPTTGTYDTKDVGTAKMVTVSGLSLMGKDAGNYVLGSSTASGPVGMIIPKPLTVTGITAQNKVYDGTTSATIDTSGATLSGVIGGDNVSLVTTGATGVFADKTVGNNKPVIVSGLSLSGTNQDDYSIGPVIGVTASITPAPLTINANPATMVYGDAVPTLTYTVSPSTPLKGSDTPATALTGALETAANPQSHVGTYPITQGSLSAVNGDYNITFTGASLTVTPAPLTITANDITKVYGAPVPTLSATYVGFKNGETAASLTTPPSLTTTATATSPVGIYPISVAGGSSGDYTITDVPGTLTVLQASTGASLSESVGSSVVGQGVAFSVQVTPVSPGAGAPTGTVTFSVDGSPVATAPVDPATGRASFTTASLGRGTHTIAATYSGDADFVSSQSGSAQETVAPAGTQTALTVQAVRNRRGKVTKVELVAHVLVAPPGSGAPSGAVTYLRKGRPFRTVALSGGRAELTLRTNQALHKKFTVQFGGDADFNASSSSSVVPTPRSLAIPARLLSALFSRR